MTRDPRTDPQRGDEVRIAGLLRRVVRVDDEIVWCQSGDRRHMMLLSRWRKWADSSGSSDQDEGLG
jgi:hypothetical protein